MPTSQILLLATSADSYKGQESLPQACPVCLHEPVNKDDCRPNKALRTTIKVFLKKKGVEREAARKKEILAQVATTTATPAMEEASARQLSEAFADPTSESQLHQADVEGEVEGTSHSLQTIENSGNVPSQSSMDIPQQSIEVSKPLLVRYLSSACG